MGRTLIHRLQTLVCRIRGHKLKVISKDVLWEYTKIILVLYE